MGLKGSAYGVFNPGWVMSGIGIGLLLQFIGWMTGIGLVAGLTGYILMGIIVGWASPGSTIIEPGVAAFFIATIGFIFNHLILSLVGVGLVVGVGYGLLGLLLGMAGGWLGEQL